MKRLALLIALLLVACGTPDSDLLPPGIQRDAGRTVPDAALGDAGPRQDAGRIDAATSDGGSKDAGSTDTGTTDAGATDAGTPDGGIDCSILQRDVCLATPGCVLDGSELQDPGYFCRDARSPCEGIADPTQCEADGACLAVAGSCYCPEGQDCLCGGGPPPACREVCGGLAGTPCPNATFFCDLPQMTSGSGPVCAGNFDQLGTCTPLPPTCSGTPNGAVCGCDQNFDPVDFVNDCERRLNGAHRGRFGACP